MQPGARSVGTGDQIWQVVPRLGDCEEQRMHCFNQTDSQDKTSDEGHEWWPVERSGVLQNDQSILIPEGVDMAICTRRARVATAFRPWRRAAEMTRKGALLLAAVLLALLPQEDAFLLSRPWPRVRTYLRSPSSSHTRLAGAERCRMTDGDDDSSSVQLDGGLVALFAQLTLIFLIPLTGTLSIGLAGIVGLILLVTFINAITEGDA